MEWYVKVLKNYAVFQGRARRKEYWMFALFNLIAGIILGILDGIIGLSNALAGVYSLFVLIPGLAVAVRRLHDTGRSGWMLLLVLIPIVGAIIILVFTCQDSARETNQYGTNPKALE